MGDVDRRRLEPLMQFLDLGAHLHPQLGVEIGQRLVEQEDLRVAYDCPAHRDALALAARQLTRIPVEIGGEPEDLGSLLHPILDRCRIGLAQPQREGHVVGHLHVRIERVVLKDHRDVAFGRRQVVDDLVADENGAGGDAFEAGDHAQEGRLSAARWPYQNHEFTVVDVDSDTVDDLHRTIRLPHAADRHFCHRPRRSLWSPSLFF